MYVTDSAITGLDVIVPHRISTAQVWIVIPVLLDLVLEASEILRHGAALGSRVPITNARA